MDRSFERRFSRRLALGAFAGLCLPPFTPGAANAAAPELGPSDADWFPFDDSQGHIAVAGAVNGHPASILLDSSSRGTIMSHAFAEKIGVNYSRKAPAGAAVGAGVDAWSERVTIAYGNTTLNTSCGLVLPGAKTAPGAGEARPPVILGFTAFVGLPMEIDFVRKRIRYLPGRPDYAGATRLPLKLQDNRLHAVQVAIEGGEPQWATFNFGSPLPLVMESDIAQARGLLEGRPVSAAVGADAAGRGVRLRTLRNVSMAGMEAPKTPFAVYALQTDWRMFVGLPLIRRLGRIIIDYKAESLYVFPSEFRPEPFTKDRLGIAPMPLDKGGWRVVDVAKGSPAHEAKWKTGDVFVSVDGHTTPAEVAAAGRALGADVVFKMADGSTRTVTPKDYY